MAIDLLLIVIGVGILIWTMNKLAEILGWE